MSVSDGSNMYDCCWIIADGEITERTPLDYLKFVEGRTSLPSEVRLTGFGTNYHAAIELGRLFRDHGIRITIGRSEPDYDPWWERVNEGQCLDACVLLMLGARERRVPIGTELLISQFHNSSMQSALAGSDFSETEAIRRRIEHQAETGLIVQYIVDMNIDPRLYTIATSVELGSPRRVLSPEEITQLDIDNSGDIAGPWQALPFGNGFYAVAETQHTNRSLMLYCLGDVSFVGFNFPMYDNERPLRALLERHGDNVLISNGIDSGQGQLQDFFRSEDGRMFVSFRISPPTAELIAGAERVMVRTPGELARVHMTSLALAFNFSDVRGNPDLPRRVLQVCRT